MDVEEGETETQLPKAATPDDVTQAEVLPLSKSQQKRLLRNQNYEEQKQAKRKRERDNRKAKRLEARLAGKDLGKEKREANARERHVVPAKIIIDCSFDELMIEKELASMAQQLSSLYHANRHSTHPFSSVVICGPADQSLLETSIGRRMETQMKGDWQRWQRVALRPNGGLEGLCKDLEDGPAVCGINQLVYLSADAEETLDQIEEGKGYIIGGIVDRNRHKNICAQKATRLGIKTAKLPIGPGRLKSSTVLTVNQVVEILLAFNETSDWELTLDRCLPRRKTKDHTPAIDEGETERL
ncbi:hypothetical protein CBS101457_000382 [Exobasidium rhododendri]|nr:hypothetical protein CBS101457_000382 [Exobasidium rhododendri]